MAILTVGVGQSYATIAAAVAATHDGDTVQVQAGVYVNDFFTVTTKITLKSLGGLAVLQATVSPPNGKAIVTTDTDVTIDGFGFTGAAVSDGNGAGIRYEAGNLIVRNSVFWDNQDGLLSAPNDTGTILIDHSEFSHNGAGDGRTHNLYVGAIASLIVQNSYFHDAVVGHEIKSRAYSTTIINNRIQDNVGDASYDIDLPNGGVNLVQGNVIEKGPNAPNYTTIHFGGEGPSYAGSSLVVANNTIVNDNDNGILVNNDGGGPTTLINNALWGFAPGNISQNGHPVTVIDDTTLATRPTLDLTTIAPVIKTVQPVTVVPTDTLYTTYGIAGAVTPSGRILIVGANAPFTTLASALVASKDGDTIEVLAGTYINDFGVVNHKVIIEGIGGIAHFVQRNVTSAPPALLVVNTDATLRNLEFSGASGGANEHEAGVLVTGGNVTISNSNFHGNDTGISATDNVATSLSVYGSEVGSNGNFDKGTHNVTIGRIGSFTLQTSYVHDALTGHEISDHAYNTDIESNRIEDGPDVNASFLIGLGQGGNALIANNTLEKGKNAANGRLINIGGEGSAYSNSNVRVINNVLISDYVNPDHPYTNFIAATADVAAAGPVLSVNNTFIGGIPGSSQVDNGTATGSKTAAPGSVVLDTSSPWSGALSHGLSKTVTGQNTLTLRLGETKGQLDAQFTVAIDGQIIGGGRVTADQATAAPQVFTYNGWWLRGNHTITVTATNLIYKDDLSAVALYVDSVSLDGNTVAATASLNYTNTSFSTTVAGTTILPDFDAAYYLAHNADVAAAGIDPLYHYMTSGWKEGRNPNAWFNTNYYLNQNPDVAAAGINPLLHYEWSGWTEGRDPSIQFSTNRYLSANPDVAAAYVDPLQQYMTQGQAQGRATYAAAPRATLTVDPLVDATFYYNKNPALAATGADAGVDYHTTGWKLGLNPSQWFDTHYYLLTNPDVAASGVDPLTHFETIGWKEGRDPSPYFVMKQYLAVHPNAATSGIDPLVTFLQSGEAPAVAATSAYTTPEAKLFDAAYYLAQNPDVAAAHVDPLVHYEIAGWKEGRNPSASFNTNKYLAANPDVAAAKIDPLFHYANFGANEHRPTFKV